jgi:hypothetical protein
MPFVPAVAVISTPVMEMNEDQARAIDLVRTGHSIFLTGKC